MGLWGLLLAKLLATSFERDACRVHGTTVVAQIVWHCSACGEEHIGRHTTLHSPWRLQALIRCLPHHTDVESLQYTPR
jgi:hypothetical protein